MPSAPAHSDSHRELMIHRAGLRREMLERISAVGVKAAERLAHRAWAPEVGNEAAANGLAYAKVSRAVRLSFILEAKIDEQILALMNGLTPTAVAWLEPAGGSMRSIPTRDTEAIERRAEGEPFDEREFDRLPSGGFKGCVAAICDDLDIEPDWSCWSDEVGFVHDNGRPVTEFKSREVGVEAVNVEPPLPEVGKATRPLPRASRVGGIRDVSD